MADFDITGPDGTKFRISGETAQGAYAALQKHIAGQQSVGDTGGFSEAMAQTTAMPGGPGAAAPKAMPTPSGIELPGEDTSPASAIAAAMGVPVAGHDPRPSVDKRTPPSPPPTPREQDPIPFGMMGGSSDDQVMWARREIARQMAETGEKPVRPDEAALIAAMSRPEKDDVVPSPTNGKPASAETVRPKRRPPPLSAFPEVAEAQGADVPLTGQDLLMAAAEASMPQTARDQIARAMGPDTGRTRAQKDDVVTTDDPFAGEGALSLTKRRGQQAAQGFTEVVASVPEALAIFERDVVRNRYGSAAAAVRGLATERADLSRIIEAQGADSPHGRAAAVRLQLVDGQIIRAARIVQEDMGTLSTPVEHTETFKAGDKLRKASSDVFGSPDPRDKGFWAQTAQGLGNAAGFATAGLAGGAVAGPTGVLVVGAGAGASMNSDQIYKEARQAGADEATALKAARFGGAIGTGEILPIGRALKILPKPLRDKVGGAFFKRFSHIAESAGEEAAQEYAAQVANNLVASGLYDPDRGWTEGAAESAIVGAVIGGGLGAVGSAMGSADDKPAPKPPARPKGASPYRPVTPVQPKPDQTPEDPLVAAMSPDAAPSQEAPDQPKAPVDVREPPVDAQQAPLTSAEAPQTPTPSKDASNEGEKINIPETAPEGGRFEVMDEIETVDGKPSPTGRKVRVNLDTGEAEVVEEEPDGSADSTGKPGPVGGAGSQPQASVEDVSSNSASPAAEPIAALPADPEGRKAPQRVFLTHDQTLGITTDPKTFQYKGGTDTEGVSDRLKGATRFDPNRAGQAVLFQRRDGTLVVADGHQRTGLARRSAEAGQEDVGGMAAVIYREADGYTPNDVMIEAALKNIGEDSGTATDAARVLRARKETIAELGLPPNSAKVRTADGLRHLSDRAFGMVANGVASERDGAAVGKHVSDPGLHGDILALLTKLKPENEAQAAMIARDAASAATTETQDSLFGPEQVQQSLFLERARVLDGALKALGKNISTFRTLVDRAESITSAGNRLAKKENESQLDDSTKVRQYLASQANMKGPISDALTQAARELKSGAPIARTVEGFVRNAKTALAGGGATGEGAARGRGETAQPVETKPVDTPTSEPDTSPDGDLLAAMSPKPPAEEPGAEGRPQSVIPGAERSDDQAKAAGEAKRKAEADARAQQSKMRRGDQERVEDEEGNLFGGPKRDLFDAPKAATTDAIAKEIRDKKARRDELLARRTEVLAPYRREGDEAFDRENGSDDLTDQPEGLDLLDALAAAETLPKKRKAAEAWALKHGRETGVEHLVTLDFDGVPLSIRRGHKSGVSPEAAVWRAGVDGKIWVSIHNHPSSSSLSGPDFAILSIWPKHTMIVVAHNGDRHEVRATAEMDRADEMARKDPVAAFDPLSEALADVVGASSWSLNEHLLDTKQADDSGHDRFIKASRAFVQLVMDELGLIVYTDKAKWLKAFEAAGFDFGEFYGKVSGPISDRLRRAGYVLPESGDRGGDQTAGSSSTAAPSGTDGADRKPARDGSESNRVGRVQASGVSRDRGHHAGFNEQDRTGNDLAGAGRQGSAKTDHGADRPDLKVKKQQSPADSVQDRFAAQLLSELAQVDDLFQNPTSDATTIEGVFADIDPSITYVGDVAQDENSAFAERAEKAGADSLHLLRTAKGSDFFVFETDDEVWIDVSGLSEGDGGSAIYSAVADYAFNARKTFIGDPDGLSLKALRRRTEAMLSSALKHGTTRHLAPHPDQIEGHPKQGVPALQWTEGDDLANLQSLIDVSLANLIHHVPEIADARYDFDTGTFRDAEGAPITDEVFRRWVSESDGVRAARAGRRTLKRGILLNTLAHAESGKRPGLLERSLRQPRQLVARGLKGTFYRRPDQTAKPAEDELMFDEDGNWKDEGPLSRDILRQYMPDLRAELDRLDLKRVRLWQDNTAADWQGMFLHYGPNDMEIIIGASMDPMKTIHHEVIHIFRAMNLLTPAEWQALETQAVKKWMAEFDIEARYPTLTLPEQLEEAIAEAFAEAAAARRRPDGPLIGQAFRKIAKLLRAIREVFTGAGFQTAEDIFGRVYDGDMTKRTNDKVAPTSEMAFAQKQALPQHMVRWIGQVAKLLGKTKPSERLPDTLELGPIPAVIRGLAKTGKVKVMGARLIMSTGKAKAIVSSHPEVDQSAWAKLPNLVADPEMILLDTDPTHAATIKIVTGYQAGESQIVVMVNTEGVDVAKRPANAVVTLYAPADLKSMMDRAVRNQHEVLYVRGEHEGAGYKPIGTSTRSASPVGDTISRLRADKSILTRSDVFKRNGDEASTAESKPTGATSLRGSETDLSDNAAQEELSDGADVFKPGLREDEPKYQAAKLPSRQSRSHMATAMGGTHTHIPDRRVWEELRRAGAPIWDRLKEAKGAAIDTVDKVRIQIQDRFLPVLRAQQAISRSTSVPLDERYDAYLSETTFSGKAGRHLFEIDEDFTKPIITLIAESNGGLTADSVGEWLTARHAEERNDRIAKINPQMPDGGSGMKTAEARNILANAAAGPHAARLAKIGDLIDQLRERSLALRVDAGLMTKDEADLWRKQYAHYVPLKGFADTDHSDAMLDATGIGRRFNVRGEESKRALGRKSEAFNPLQAAITQAQEVAIRAEKAHVGAALYRLAKDFPSKALWEVKKVETRRVFNKTTGLVQTQAVDPLSMILQPNEVAVKVDGEEYRIIFHDPRLARAAGSVGADQMNWFVSVMSHIGRWFSMTRTMLNPEFVITNAFRDMTAAQINIQNFGEADRASLAKAMIKTWPKAFAGVFRGIANKTDSEWTKNYRDFARAGGKVEFWTMENPESGLKDLDQRIWLASGPRAARIMKRFVSPSAFFSTRDNGVLHFVERMNMAVDNAIRLAAFVEARKRGWTDAQAAALSKNLTVNFNRRGEASPTINALYVFFNAAVQGSATTVKAIGTSRRVQSVAVGLIAAGLLNDMANAWLSEEDDDDVLAYDKIPDFQSQRAIQFMMGRDADDAISIPMPYGYNIFPYLGQQIGKVLRGVKEPDEALGDVGAAVMGAFSPVQGGDLYSFLAPTVIDPVLEMARNLDWLGRPIKPDYQNDRRPESQKFFAGASEVSKAIAAAANAMTGGTTGLSGAVDVSPEYIDHASAFIFGSMGSFAGRSVDLVAKVAAGETSDLTVNDIPMARVLIKDTYAGLDRDRYFRFRDRVNAAVYAVKTSKTTGEQLPDEVRLWASLEPALKVAEKRRKDGEDIYLKFNRKVTKTVGPIGE